MAIYLIYACEGQYHGLHGMEDWTIEKCDYKEACDTGYQMSIEVMESYEGILDELQNEAEQYAREDGVADLDWDEAVDNIFCELQNDNVEYEIYELRDDKTVEEYLNMIREGNIDWEEVRDLYGV